MLARTTWLRCPAEDCRHAHGLGFRDECRTELHVKSLVAGSNPASPKGCSSAGRATIYVSPNHLVVTMPDATTLLRRMPIETTSLIRTRSWVRVPPAPHLRSRSSAVEHVNTSHHSCRRKIFLRQTEARTRGFDRRLRNPKIRIPQTCCRFVEVDQSIARRLCQKAKQTRYSQTASSSYGASPLFINQKEGGFQPLCQRNCRGFTCIEVGQSALDRYGFIMYLEPGMHAFSEASNLGRRGRRKQFLQNDSRNRDHAVQSRQQFDQIE